MAALDTATGRQGRDYGAWPRTRSNELCAVEPAEFTALRAKLAAATKQRGDAAAAKRISAAPENRRRQRGSSTGSRAVTPTPHDDACRRLEHAKREPRAAEEAYDKSKLTSRDAVRLVKEAKAQFATSKIAEYAGNTRHSCIVRYSRVGA